MNYIGYAWLKNHLQINTETLSTICLAGRENETLIRENGIEERFFGPKYVPNDAPLAHIEFALKYEHLHLSLLCQVFQKIDRKSIQDFIKAKPSGIYTRKIGFLFEFLTKQALPIDFAIGGNYIPMLNETTCLVGKTVKNEKWRIKNNLLGSSDFCPLVIITEKVRRAVEYDIGRPLVVFQKKYNQSVYRRAFSYLYTKETKSSFAIEREKPSQNKMEKFVALLTQAGVEADTLFLSEASLAAKQNKIVDARFADTGWRDFQNYIGETLPDYAQLVHYVCPPPTVVRQMMEGLNECFQKSKDNNAVIVATLIAFGFVFIHPFDDGNGRLHRYLIHDILVRKKAVSSGTIIPVSAQMLENIDAYNSVLEAYSKPLSDFVNFSLDEQGLLTILNPEEVVSYFKYPNLTVQCEYLFDVLVAAIHSIESELEYLDRYDSLKNEIGHYLNLPDKMLNHLIIFIHQNKGALSKNKRRQFEKLTDREIEVVEALYDKVFNAADRTTHH